MSRGLVPSTVCLSRASGIAVLFPVPGMRSAYALLRLQSYRATQLWLRLAEASPAEPSPSLVVLCTSLRLHRYARQTASRPTFTVRTVVIIYTFAVPKKRSIRPVWTVIIKKVSINNRTTSRQQHATRTRPVRTLKVVKTAARSSLWRHCFWQVHMTLVTTGGRQVNVTIP